MRNTVFLPRYVGKDDLNRRLIRRAIRIAFPTPESPFEELLTKLEEAEKNPVRKDDYRQ